jgi:UDP-N-acetylglucosamine--N-acetylmuramyl-(pentapeptide) pyrophosphoryl-undecaprenol N-acetylglucosamine transferase
VALNRGGWFAFVRGFVQSYRAARKLFQSCPPDAVLAMGGFTAAPPIFAGKRCGAAAFLHESNTIPGRANRWLARLVDQAFVGFSETALRLHNRSVTVTGTPVRSQFRPPEPAKCRAALGLEPNRPVLLIMGGSQGASGINDLVVRSLPLLAQFDPDLQYFHLTGQNEFEKIKQAVAGLRMKSVVYPFFAAMDLALGAATVAISRAGASSLAELAAMRIPAVLIPFPSATGNHQYHNAHAFATTGAAGLLEQKNATPGALSQLVVKLTGHGPARERMRDALSQWHRPRAAAEIAERMLRAISAGLGTAAEGPAEAPVTRLDSHQSAVP